MFYLKRKLGSAKPKSVFLAVSLVEALVKNCGRRFHATISVDATSSSGSFMKEMAKVARKFSGKSGSENIEVAELVLDVIQAWGEAFLTLQKEYPAFSKVYHELRKEGLHFKTQCDPNRVPIFINENSSESNRGTGSPVVGQTAYASDIALAAALAASMNLTPQPVVPTKRNMKAGKK